MSWNAKVTRYVDNDAEIIVHVDYFDFVPGQSEAHPLQAPVHHEEATFPSGTPKLAIQAEFGRRGRSARLARGKLGVADEMVGDTFQIDDV